MQKKFSDNWSEIKRKPRIEIHINSLSISELKRMTMSKFMQKENAQISRIFALKDKNTEIIYISPFELSSDIINYYYKILEIGESEQSQARFNLIVPDKSEKLPTFMHATALLLYSSKTLKKIKNLVRLKNAYIVPGIVSNDEITLSLKLDIPILCGEPQKMRLYSSKSGSRRIFSISDVPIPIGAYDIYDENEFEITLTKLVLSHPQISTWIFKIDGEYNGRGTAYLNIENISEIKEIRKNFTEIGEQEIESIQRILHRELRTKAQFAMPNLFKTWNVYIKELCKNGGVIEARPNCKKSDISSPSISFFIEPNGSIEVIGSYDKIQINDYVNLGCIFPQKSLPNIVSIKRIFMQFRKQ